MFRKRKYKRKQVGKFVKQLDWPEHMIVVYLQPTFNVLRNSKGIRTYLHISMSLSDIT